MIIPIFIPHAGCPNDCAFCNQRTISGKISAPCRETVISIIEEHLSTCDARAKQIAFFGGSFTGIKQEEQNEYLSIAENYIKKGLVESIRLSTRPDYIDSDTVKRLVSYGVTNIELGAQSMNDDVLRLSKRGHNAYAVEKASEIINSSSARLGLQMMTGLPGDNREKCIYTARKFKELGAKETRIYPTVVLKGTHLAKMYENGEYRSQYVEEAVDICAQLYRYFTENEIKILRIGLSDSPELKNNFIAGAYHPSMGELVISRDIRNRIEKAIGDSKKALIYVNKRFMSKVVGNKKCNIEYFGKRGVELKIIEEPSVCEFKVKSLQ